MGIEFFWEEGNLHLNLINIYGPYNNKVAFRESVQASQFLKRDNVVIVGDLNFTLGGHEIRGPNARTDSLDTFFKNLLENLKLVNMEPQNLNPTWTNIIYGENQIAKI